MTSWNLDACFKAMAAYRLVHEQGYKESNVEDRKWCVYWPCRGPRSGVPFRAHIYVQGPGMLGYTNPGPKIAKTRSKLLAVRGVRAWQTGDREFSVIFPLAALPEVAALVRPLRRRSGNHNPDRAGLRTVADVEEEGRQGRIGCVGCWDTLQKRAYAEAPRWPGLADVGRETKA